MKKLLAVSAIAALGFTSVAFAGGLPEEMPAAPAAVASSDMGVYVGIEGGLGLTNWKNSTIAIEDGVSTSNDNGVVGRAFLGYDVNRYFALEAGYTYFFNKAKFTYNNAEFNKIKNTQVIDAMLKGKLPVVDNFDLYAKCGVNYLMSKFDKDTNDGITKIETSRNSFNVGFGAGADYYITPNIIANVEWLRFNGNAKNDTKYQPNTDAFMVGLRYKFDL
jgi:opacity protein-like surface antigen